MPPVNDSILRSFSFVSSTGPGIMHTYDELRIALIMKKHEDLIHKIEPNHDRQVDKEPLLTIDLQGARYRDVYDELQTLRINPERDDRLVHDVCEKIMSYLVIRRVVPEEVRVLDASSHDKIHPLICSLYGDEDTWWLSGYETMRCGRGCQWVQYYMGDGLRRLSTVFLKIPPLPQGPLSVKDFCLQTFTLFKGWHNVTPIFSADNVSGWQRFDLPEPCDVQEIRFVCLNNQISSFINEHDPAIPESQLRRLEAVGFYAVRFE